MTKHTAAQQCYSKPVGALILIVVCLYDEVNTEIKSKCSENFIASSQGNTCLWNLIINTLRVGFPMPYILGYLIFLVEKGNGNPLQYSCLENPMDGGAWWAAVYCTPPAPEPSANRPGS